MTEITKELYVEWKNHTVTKELLAHLREVREATAGAMISEGIIMHTDCPKLMARSLGILEGLDTVLQLAASFEDDEEEFFLDEREEDL